MAMRMGLIAFALFASASSAAAQNDRVVIGD